MLIPFVVVIGLKLMLLGWNLTARSYSTSLTHELSPQRWQMNMKVKENNSSFYIKLVKVPVSRY